jgi:hypothetical protein
MTNTPRTGQPRDLATALEGDGRLDVAADLLGRATPLVGEGGRAAFLRGEWLGHALHPMLTDIPVGCWTSAAMLDVLGGRAARPAAQRLVGLGLLAVPITALSGLADWSATKDPRIGRVGAVHALANVAATAAYFASWRSRRAGHHGAGIVFGAVGAGIASVAGYLGGHMAFARSAPESANAVEDAAQAADAARDAPLRETSAAR